MEANTEFLRELGLAWWGAMSDQIHAYGTHDLGGNPSVSIRVPIWVLRRWKVLTSHHRNKSLRRAEDLNFYDIFILLLLLWKRESFFSHRVEYKQQNKAATAKYWRPRLIGNTPISHFASPNHTHLIRLWAQYERVGITCDWQYPGGVLCTLLVPTLARVFHGKAFPSKPRLWS